MHNSLNPKLFDSNNLLRPDVRESLLDISENFLQDLEIPLRVADIQMVGSNASYNYTESSDIDLHIISNTDSLNYDCSSIILMYYNLEKTLWNREYTPTIHGIPVEIYVEDVNTSSISNGIYSVLEDTWVKFPKKLNLKEPNLEPLLTSVQSMVLRALSSFDLDLVQTVIDDLYMIRKNSLSSDGENGVGNLVFKRIRDLGFLDDLRERESYLVSRSLSL